ncbi:uncharacterized protein LOC110450718 [Mizuhopecten yessoensis]|uniref:Mid2 domain-containing protein n=1 Tax=Mizuhopecten yessoensis TaxID=6573 RepID=A0A210QN97_MIZYE|nr:uncharacterized protein LOC110450718 [Mizuhopecten yessoensis]XP_021354064.1 uncharacterized protein LOC110450718 [Mizuhopecten yessoensis]OWF50216.1 hypothetical protein KP79_PYT06745 [Mizuhopecten yessoensis]
MADLTSTTVAVTTSIRTTPPSTSTVEDGNTTATISSTTQTSTELISSTNATSTTISTTPGGEEPNHVGAIVGGVVGGILMLLVIAAVVIFIFRWKRRKRKKQNEKSNNLQVLPPSVSDLVNMETMNYKDERKRSKKPTPVVVSITQSFNEPHYENKEPSYVKPEPPTRDIYSGPDNIEYYMGNDTTTTNEEPTEMYSDADTPNLRQTKNFPSEEAPKPPNTNSVLETSKEQEPRDYENVPKKRTEPPKADPTQTSEVEEDEEQTVYENQK